jgi:hypothetical protein
LSPRFFPKTTSNDLNQTLPPQSLVTCKHRNTATRRNGKKEARPVSGAVGICPEKSCRKQWEKKDKSLLFLKKKPDAAFGTWAITGRHQTVANRNLFGPRNPLDRQGTHQQKQIRNTSSRNLSFCLF